MQDLLKVNKSLTVKTKIGLLSPLYNLASIPTAVRAFRGMTVERSNKSCQYHLVSFVKWSKLV